MFAQLGLQEVAFLLCERMTKHYHVEVTCRERRQCSLCPNRHFCGKASPLKHQLARSQQHGIPSRAQYLQHA